ncbi:glycosyltransferase family 4 protein [Flavobacterium piscisymbiosum]|uniref:Glycosyltransferase family 4 protein n=1 Tax=Flavobacterium piscisymbiosum TaxID=2893753 RepID=A0ABS8M8D9_9FLAO|nr:glycosyltransferase family 1 protein [Flavobacterium sp. F-30]MCC9061739.1 glycosyltransferase family 4 protein [Flavobacterium sp. F-30]
MEVFLDNIIFSLQKSGGVSVVWEQHLKRILVDQDFQCNVLEYDSANSNFFRQQISINSDLIDLKTSRLLFLNRYLNINSKEKGRHIFHSSYYRTENNKNAINVTTVHDFTYEHFVKGISQKIHSWQKNNAINNSEGIICVSNSTKRDLLNYLPHIKENKIKVIYNGVDNSFHLLKEDVFFDKKHNFEDFSYALYIGDRRAKYKNFYMAVDACALANIPLLIVGGGELSTEELFNLQKKLGDGNFFALLGVKVDDLNYYYNKAFCLLYPSLYEGFGIPVVEAQRTGCPVIASDSSSIPEIIGNQYLAIKDPTPQKIAKRIQELVLNSNLRKEAIELGLEKASTFSWENSYNQTSEFYKELYKS